MIIKQENKPVKRAYGVDFKTLATGDRIMCTIMRCDKGGKVPKHKHPAEQVGYIIKGRFRLWINDQEIGVVEPGDSYVIKSSEFHSMEILEDSEWVDMFSPPREEYMDE